MTGIHTAPLNVYISCSDSDQALLERLEDHLSALHHQGLITLWHIRRILPGADRTAEITRHLEEAQVILLLVSASYLGRTDRLEVERAMERHRADLATVVPVILRPCTWQSEAYGRLQCLPRHKAITEWNDRDVPLAEVATGLRELVERRREAAQGGIKEIDPSRVVPGPAIDPVAVENASRCRYQYLPRVRPVAFVGRTSELEQLHLHLQKHERVVITAIAGMGGVGKSELAYQYARSHLADYVGGVCWIDCRARSFGEQLLEFVQVNFSHFRVPDVPGLEARIRYCWHHWPEGKALIVLDDVSSYAGIAPFLPPDIPPHTGQFHILITTRKQWLDRDIRSLSIDVLREPAAETLLEALAGEARIRGDVAAARALVTYLGCLPLALELAGRYMAHLGLGAAEMLKRLRNKGLDSPGLRSQEELGGPPGLIEAFDLSWQELNDKPLARELICLLSMFGPAPVPWPLVTRCLSDRDAEDLEVARSFDLANLSLIGVTPGGACKLHPLIRQFVRRQCHRSMIEADRLRRMVCQVLTERAGEMPRFPVLSQTLALAPLIPHLEEAAAGLTPPHAEEPALLRTLGHFFGAQGLYERAEHWFERCLRATVSRAGDEHPEVAIDLHNLAEIYNQQGRYGDAEPLCRRALDLFSRASGVEQPIAVALNNLARLYHSQGRYEEAEPLFQQALDIYRRMPEDEHGGTARVLNNYAELLRNWRRYDEAEPLILRAVESCRRSFGDESPEMLSCLNNLALLHKCQGRYDEAEALYRSVIVGCGRLLGEGHPKWSTSLNNLGKLYLARGEFKEAESLLQRALDFRRRFLGEDHPDIAQSLVNLALLRSAQGEDREAEPLYVQALRIYQLRLGPDHPNTVSLLEKLGHVRARPSRV